MNLKDTHKTEIEKYNACKEAVEYRKQFKTFKEAWENCLRGDWMLWIAKRAGVNKRTLTLATARCAKTVVHLMKDERSIKAVEVAENYGQGLVSVTELENAASAACAAYATAADAYDAYAAYAAYATATYADAYDAYASTYASAYASVYASAAYAYDAARKENQLQTANICRELLTEEILKTL